jgi:hypothetical protein
MSIENLLAAWNSIDWTPPGSPEYRIYYDPTTGKILNYTNEDIPGDFIVVSREIFAQHRFDLTVKQGKLINPCPTRGKLIPSDDGVACHPRNLTIIDNSADSIKWKMKTYEN